MNLFIWSISFVFLTTINGKYDGCLHNETKGKHCTSNTNTLLNRLLIQPTTTENEECYRLCIQSGYAGGGQCSVSKTCFRFCSCYHSMNITSIF